MNKNQLTENEMNLMEDALNGVMLNQENIKEDTILTIRDSFKFFHLDEKWNVNPTELLNKLHYMDENKIIEVVKVFWNGECLN